MLVLYHEMMQKSEMTDYFSRLFYPVIPLAVLGRSYQVEPKCSRETSVYWNWQESVTKHVTAVVLVDMNRT